MEKFQEKKIEFLKWENEQLKLIIKDYVINDNNVNYNYDYSKILRDNFCEIKFLTSSNQSLVDIYKHCDEYFKPQIYPREIKKI
jgi:bisphosphoglycerate-dependent phosphoglycerate mutase